MNSVKCEFTKNGDNSDKSKKKNDNSKINIGKLIDVHGVRGEFKLKSHLSSDQSSKLINKKSYLNDDEFKIERVRSHGDLFIIKFYEINSIDKAKEYRKNLVFINRADLGKLPSDTYYVSDLVGMTVFSVDGKELGKLVNCMSTGSNDVYTIQTMKNHEEILIPAIKEVIKIVDLESKTMVIQLLEGLV